MHALALTLALSLTVPLTGLVDQRDAHPCVWALDLCRQLALQLAFDAIVDGRGLAVALGLYRAQLAACDESYRDCKYQKASGASSS